MISVVIPALNAERHLPATLTALVPAAVNGIVREVIVADGGSMDRTRNVADHSGAEFVQVERGRGPQLAQGAALARFPWLLFLHADTVLESGWSETPSISSIRSIPARARRLLQLSGSSSMTKALRRVRLKPSLARAALYSACRMAIRAC